jgi:predicted aconitase
MLDYTLDEVLLAHLKAVPALASIHGYTGQDNAEHKLPALTVSTSSETLAGSDSAFRGEVGVTIESEAHDTTPPMHGERVEAVRAALANRAAAIAAINATGQIHIYGFAPLGTEPTAGDARFATKLKYRFGFGPA